MRRATSQCAAQTKFLARTTLVAGWVSLVCLVGMRCDVMWLVAGWDEVMWLLTRWDDGMSCHLASGGECDEMWCEGIGWDAVVIRCGCVLRWVGRWCAVMTLPRKYAPAKYRARHEKWHSNFTKYSQRVTLEFLWLFLPVALPFCDVCFLYCCSCLPNSPDFLIFLDVRTSEVFELNFLYFISSKVEL